MGNPAYCAVTHFMSLRHVFDVPRRFPSPPGDAGSGGEGRWGEFPGQFCSFIHDGNRQGTPLLSLLRPFLPSGQKFSVPSE